MGKYRTGNMEWGPMIQGSNSDVYISINRCKTRSIGGQMCVFGGVGPAEYYMEIASKQPTPHKAPLRENRRFSMETVIEIYDKQIEAGDIEYNWLDEYNTPTVEPGTTFRRGCYACGSKEMKTESELTSDNVKTDRPEYVNNKFHMLFDLHSEYECVFRRKWHEDCVLSILNPAINQAVLMCKEEGALQYLREDNSVHPEKFTD